MTSSQTSESRGIFSRAAGSMWKNALPISEPAANATRGTITTRAVDPRSASSAPPERAISIIRMLLVTIQARVLTA